MTIKQATNPSFADEIRRSFSKQAIMGLIGGELTRVEPGVVEISLTYRPDLTQQNGFVHAGIVTTIADSACGYAAYSLMPPESDVLAVEFKVNLLRPAKGEKFVARAEVIKPGRTLTVVRADVVAIAGGEDRELVATMLGTMISVERQLLIEAMTGLDRDEEPDAAAIPGVAEFDAGFLYGLAFARALDEAKLEIDRVRRRRVLRLVKGSRTRRADKSARGSDRAER